MLVCDYNKLYKRSISSTTLTNLNVASLGGTLYDIDYNPTTDHIYWAADTKVGRCNSDGSNSATVISSPQTITFDSVSQTCYGECQSIAFCFLYVVAFNVNNKENHSHFKATCTLRCFIYLPRSSQLNHLNTVVNKSTENIQILTVFIPLMPCIHRLFHCDSFPCAVVTRLYDGGCNRKTSQQHYDYAAI